MEQTTAEKLRYAEMWRQQQMMNNGCGTPLYAIIIIAIVLLFSSCATKKEKFTHSTASVAVARCGMFMALSSYPSINEASRVTGIDATAISYASRNKKYKRKDGRCVTVKTAGGYLWAINNKGNEDERSMQI